ncbi:MAG: dockerin type I domain-containing protein [bacterium]|nr:dockerin type I domain-containing protein [bacterium]
MKLARLLFVPLLAGILAAAVEAQTFPITNFEAFPAPSSNGAVMFRQPSFSGSTSTFIATGLPAPNNTTQVVAVGIAASGTKSLRVVWQFVANRPGAWLRLTTFNTANLPNPAISYAHALRFKIYVASGTPDLYVTLGTRDNANTAPIGGNGGASGSIEWVGATSGDPITGGYTRPVGKLITAKDQWVEVVFNLPIEPCLPFASAAAPAPPANGVLDGPQGTIECLAFTPVEAGAVGPYVVYLDDFEQVAVHPISGNVELREFEGDITQVPVTVELRQDGNVVRTATVNLDANGGYTIPAVLPGTYDLAFKASHWLRTVVTGVTVAESPVTGVDVSLTNGDIDGDNEVSITDFGALVAAFGSVPGNDNWNANADLNGDGDVSLLDLGILVRNFGSVGDE